MAVKNYGIRDQWTNLDKLNNVDIKSVDGVIESVKINGEEAGGGGSSDFSTAEVIVGSGVVFNAPVVINEEEFQGIALITGPMEEEMIWQVPLYKGKCLVDIYTSDEGQSFSVSGDIIKISDGVYRITGDCTITIS